MNSGGQQYLANTTWLAIYPGLVLMVLVAGISLLGDGLGELAER